MLKIVDGNSKDTIAPKKFNIFFVEKPIIIHWHDVNEAELSEVRRSVNT
jgi:hypothetical protein